MIHYQGRLYDSSNNLLGGSSGTTYYFKFSIWKHATSTLASDRQWPASDPTAKGVTVTNGVFNCDLGSSDATTGCNNAAEGDLSAVDFQTYGDSLYLQIEVSTTSGGTFEALSPRQRIVAEGNAVNANLLQGASPGTGANNILKLNSSGGLDLSGTNPTLSATGANTLTLNSSSTGAIQFFNSTYSLSNTGSLTIGSITGSGALTIAAGGTNTNITINANGTGKVVLGAASTGNIEFFNSSNNISSSGNLTVVGGVTAATTTLSASVAAGGGNVASISQTNAAAATGTRSALNLSTLGITAGLDFLIYSTPFQVDYNGAITATGNINLNDASADTILIGQSGATDDIVTIAGDISLTDDNWSIDGTGNSSLGPLQLGGGASYTALVNTTDQNSTIIVRNNSGIVTDAALLIYEDTLGGGIATGIRLGANLGTGIDVGNNTIINAGSITGITNETINGIDISAGAVSDVTTLSLSGAITGATATNTINGLIINGSTQTLSANNFADSGALTISSGGTSDLTFDSASNNLIIAATDTALKRTAAGVFTIDLNDAADTTLALTNSNATAGIDAILRVDSLISCDTIDTDASGNLVCGTDATGAGGGISTIQENDVDVVTSATVIDFLGSDFIVGAVGSEGNISIDYANSEITRNNQNETIINPWTFDLAEAESLATNLSISGTQAGQAQSITVTNSSTSGNQYGLKIDNAVSTGTTDALIYFDNSDTDTVVTSAIQVANVSRFTNILDIGGTLLTATELSLIDGKTTLVDIDDAVSTAITGTGALNSGSITSGFGSIDVGTDAITTTGTVTGGAGTFTNASNQIILGTGAGTTGTITWAISGGNKTITLPNETGTVCTTGSVCSGYQASGSYANTALSNLASVAINTTLLPNANNTIDLGSGTLQFRTGYIGTSLVLGTSGANSTTLNFTAPTAANTITIPNAGGTVAVSGASPISVSAAGAISVADATTADKGIASFNSTNFTVASGAVNTIQNIATTSSPTFGGLTLSGAGQPVLAITSTGTSGNSITFSNSSYTANSSLTNLTFTNANAGVGPVTVSGVAITPTGSTNANANANILNAINLPNVTTVANNAFYALNIGTGYNDILRYNGAQLISGTGIIQSGAVSGSYTGITGVGALDAGSITANFGSIDIGTDAITGGAGSLTTLSATGNINFDDTSADTIVIGQSGAADDTVTIAGNVSITDDDWGISATGVGTNLVATDLSCTNCIGATEIDESTISSTGLSDTADIAYLNQSESVLNDWTFSVAEAEDLAINLSISGTQAGQAQYITLTNATTAGNQYALRLDNAASTGTTDALVYLDNSDTDTVITTAIQIANVARFTNVLDLGGTLLTSAELGLLDSGIAHSELTDSGTLTAATVDINGGNIDGTAIGATTRAAGNFTTLDANGNVTLGDVNTDTLTINTGSSGSGIALADDSFNSCSALETSATGVLTCGTDDTGAGGGGIATIEENDTSVVTSATVIDFLGSDFIVGAVGSEGNISIDYANSGITRNNQSETINNDWTFSLAEAEDLALNLSISGTQAGQAQFITLTNSSTGGNQYGLRIDNAASTGTTDALIYLDNSDTDTVITSAIQLANIARFTNVMDLGGTLLTTTELGLLDGKTTLVDIDDAVSTAITGTGALNSGSITSGFGSIDVGTDAITTTGTVTGGAGTFTTLSASDVISANGGLTVAANQDLTLSSGTGTLAINSTVTATDNALLITPSYSGTTGGNTYNLISTAAFTASNTTGTDTVNGISIGNLTQSGAGTITATALKIGTGWDNGIDLSSSFNQTAGSFSFSNGSATFNLQGSSGTLTGVNGLTLSTSSAGGTANISLTTNNNTGGPSGSISLEVGSSSAGTPNINIGTNTNAKNINIGTGAVSTAITIGNSTGGALRVGQNGGTLQLDGTNFDVSTAGTATIAASQSYTGLGAVTLSSGGSSGLTLDSASGRLTVATGDFLNTGVSGVSGAAAGDIWYDSAAGKYKINEGGTTKTLCNLTDLGCGAGGSTTLDTIAAAAGAASINNGDNAIVWNWQVTTASKVGFKFAENAASTGSGSVILGVETLASSTAIPLRINNVGAAVAFLVQDNGTTAFSVNADGSLNLGRADGGINVTIGDGSSSTTPNLLVLDQKSDTGDPTGTNGAIYYNASSNKFRCYQNGAWADCITTGGGGGVMTLLDETVLAANAASITVGPFTATEYMKCYLADKGLSAAVFREVQFNNDTGTNYHVNQGFLVAAAVTDAQLATQSRMRLDASAADVEPATSNFEMGNFASVKKSVSIFTSVADGTQPNITMAAGIWNNTSAQVTEVDFILSGAGNYLSGSKAWCEGR